MFPDSSIKYRHPIIWLMGQGPHLIVTPVAGGAVPFLSCGGKKEVAHWRAAGALGLVENVHEFAR